MPSFFDSYKPAPVDIRYIKGPEKDVLIENAVPLPVLGVFKSPGYENNGYQFGLVTEVEAERAAITFHIGDVQSRDEFFEAVQAYLAKKDELGSEFETPVVVMKRVGRSVILVNADEEE